MEDSMEVGDMREACLDCARKHLAQAEVLMLEYATGDYPVHKWYAIGHLAEAADELMQQYPSVADRIRKERIEYMADDSHEIDTAELIELLTSFDEQIKAAEAQLNAAEASGEGEPQETGEQDET